MQVKHLLLIAILALTAACSSKEVIDENLSEVELYQQAQADLFAAPLVTEAAGPSPLESRLHEIDPDALTPREALDALYALKKLALRDSR